jgi:hypothetical protein
MCAHLVAMGHSRLAVAAISSCASLAFWALWLFRTNRKLSFIKKSHLRMFINTLVVHLMQSRHLRETNEFIEQAIELTVVIVLPLTVTEASIGTAKLTEGLISYWQAVAAIIFGYD